ncbi:MAG TPA: hypothetical protein VGP82_14390, partial [Ktedonobacterales bacterium]|nr:hypothetical protein [Ktedonobacterales bacterium]
AEDEVEALLAFLRETGVQLVQLRNLNIDPEVFLPKVPKAGGKPLGIPVLIETLRREVPEVVIGNFSRPVLRQRARGAAGAARQPVPAQSPAR